MTEQNLFNRRQFLGFLGTATAAFGLTACGGSSSSNGSSASGSTDSITYSLTADPRAIDPAYFDDGESAVVCTNIYEGLYGFAEKDATVVLGMPQVVPSRSTDWIYIARGPTDKVHKRPTCASTKNKRGERQFQEENNRSPIRHDY